MEIPDDLLYTKDHEWVRIEGKNADVGITEYAQHSLGDITFVELPRVQEQLKQSAFCSTVESVKAASEVYAPLNGKVLAVNPDLAAHPELINQSPYEKGYFFTMELSDDSGKENLIQPAAYRKYIEGLAK